VPPRGGIVASFVFDDGLAPALSDALLRAMRTCYSAVSLNRSDRASVAPVLRSRRRFARRGV